MFLTDSAEDDVIKLRSSLSDIKFIAQETLIQNKRMSEKIKSILDDIIKIADVGMYKPRENAMQRAKQKFVEKHGSSCEEDK